jgi:hypothetical protein
MNGPAFHEYLLWGRADVVELGRFRIYRGPSLDFTLFVLNVFLMNSEPSGGQPPLKVEDQEKHGAVPSAKEKGKRNSSVTERIAFSLDEQRREENHRP